MMSGKNRHDDEAESDVVNTIVEGTSKVFAVDVAAGHYRSLLTHLVKHLIAA